MKLVDVVNREKKIKEDGKREKVKSVKSFFEEHESEVFTKNDIARVMERKPLHVFEALIDLANKGILKSYFTFYSREAVYGAKGTIEKLEEMLNKEGIRSYHKENLALQDGVVHK